MNEKLKRFASHGCCFAGVLSVGAIAVGGRVLAPTDATAQGVETRVVAAAEGSNERAPAVRQHVDSVAKSYLTVQKLLAQDKMDGVGAELKKIRDAAAALAESGKGEVQAQAKTLAKHADVQPKNLKDARAAFKPLSSAVIGLVKVVPPSAEAAPELYEATCPMAKANWLQETKEIRNPYMGQEMLECGSVERKIEPPKGGKEGKEQASRAGDLKAAAVAGGSTRTMSCCASLRAPSAGTDGSSCN